MSDSSTRYRYLLKSDPEIASILEKENARQEDSLILIASENYTSQAVLEASASVMTNKYAEGYPGRRYYNGCAFVDEAEALAIERIKKLFGAEAANVQPHSGTQANMAVLMSVLSPGDTFMGMDLAHGGHLSHGLKVNLSGLLYNIVPYGVDRTTEQFDYAAIRALAREHKPKLVISGASAYPRTIDFDTFTEIAHEVGALHMADIAHIAGMVAVGLHPSPVPSAEFVTSTTHKTLRGPRGGIVMCKGDWARKIDSRIFPGTQGGPLMHIITAKAVAFGEALRPEFRVYQQQILDNAQALGAALTRLGNRLVSGGTDNHLMLVDLRPNYPDVTGKDAEGWLERASIITNKNMIPFDERKPVDTSGLRIGTPALTTRGMGAAEMETVAGWIDRVLRSRGDGGTIERVRAEVLELCKQFPLP